MDSRARRIGENEILFREVNVQLRALDARLGVANVDSHAFLCECGNIDCRERIRLGVDDYERIHADPAQFAIVPGHERPSVEYVVERHDDYAVVRKREEGPAHLARDHAPG